jgi:biotin synthase
MRDIRKLIDQLEEEKILAKEELLILLKDIDREDFEYLREKARAVAKKHFGNRIYTRGLVEFTNYCRNDCYYCGIRRSNQCVKRYRLTKEQILSCCREGYELGFRTFVLQGGEDLSFKDDAIVEIIRAIKAEFPDCALTLSIGEKSEESYQRYFAAGADRYLLRHETANEEHYAKLHPSNLSLENRKQCLYSLKRIGYQVGAGFMVGSPYQTLENIVEDVLFLKELDPEMVGIGPFLPHHETPFAAEPKGSMEQTLRLISILRLMLPNALIPATTALGTIHPTGREEGILSGANVVMPNLSPTSVRKNYELYDNKICTGDEAAECRFCLERRMKKIGYELAVDRGDYKKIDE